MKVKLLLESDVSRKEVEYDVESAYHLENIMKGLIFICDEDGHCYHTVTVISPKKVIEEWDIKKATIKEGK